MRTVQYLPSNHFPNNDNTVLVLELEAIGHPTSYNSL